ncbi:MAG: DNA replication and repair protein RecF [Flavobacteriales bacterium TMED288]|nr:DNA replication and repair protein RecF [Flavobacteriales bacterium]RPG52781.1 MAG: DNA replication and repair protein RecF [Flavobacteriales bacterium TMED288]|tara:strand:+ start:158 stop:1258 length:1101 start_codon:yes stop_codon:yes gene_type:complete
MNIKTLSLIFFKNYEELNINFSKKINLIIGNNGAGKTNLLDAIYYLAFCKSYFNSRDINNIKFGEFFFSIKGVFKKNNSVEHVYCAFKKGQKKVFKRNNKKYLKYSDHLGFIPLVMLSPLDINLINEGSEFRRRFIDSVLSQFNNIYLKKLIKYNEVLKSRNIYLKQRNSFLKHNDLTLEIYNEQMSNISEYIHDEREKFIQMFNPIFKNFYKKISNQNNIVNLSYQSQLNNSKLNELLKVNFNKDKLFQYTTCGIHKDDILMQTNENLIKKIGSQGEIKSYLIALKLSQFYFLKTILKLSPILLIDDLIDKLDLNRVEAIIEIISKDDFGQVLISDTNNIDLENIIKKYSKNYEIFRVKNAKILS